tara:strand:- start:878 stop:1234 length:357 start_codon:yes stop_codon:yes gene_type:complete
VAQDFERKIPFNGSGDIAIGTTARTVLTSNGDDALIGIRLVNITNATIQANVFVTSTASGGSANSFLVYKTPIAAGGQYEAIDGGSKIVLQNGDVLQVQSDTASSLHGWISFIDNIST